MRYIFLFTTVLSACSAYPDLSGLQREPQVSTFSDDAQLKLESRPTPRANEYAIDIKWQLAARTTSILSLYRIQAGQRTFLKTLSQSEGEFRDAPLESNTFYRYEISDESAQVVSTASIRNARDLLVEGEMRLPQDYASISRLFFSHGATLVTEGLPLEWKLDLIQGATGASLVSFVKDRSAQAGYSARSSGIGRLEVRQAGGPLRLEWRGEMGPEGQAGMDNPRSGKDGRKGSPGRTFRGGRPGNFRCTSGERGANGGRGPRGGPGATGETGGALETLELKILYAASDLLLDVIADAGQAGRGGRGGRGGAGGAPGPGGVSGGIRCGPGPAGKAGPRGKSGPVGQPGQVGEVRGEVCISVGDHDVGCSKAGQSLKFPK